MKSKLLTYIVLVGGIMAQSRSLPADTTVMTMHRTTIQGKRIEYKATTGTQPVWDEDGKSIAASESG